MITIRNADNALPLSARAADADLKPGMLVKLVAGDASGDQPKATKPSAADITGGVELLGIVDYIAPDSQAVDYSVNTPDMALTALDNTIPQGAQVTVWFGRIVVGYTKDSLDASLDPATVREPTKVGFNATTHVMKTYNSANADGSQRALGIVWRVDGPEVTLLLDLGL